jgi:tetratricopeptide (TPR) repeat protein
VTTEALDLYVAALAIIGLMGGAVLMVNLVARLGRRRPERQFSKITNESAVALRAGRYTEAAESAHEAIRFARKARLGPAFEAFGHQSLGTVLARQYHDQEALERFEEARKVFSVMAGVPSGLQAYLDANVSLLLHRLGRTAEALENARRAAAQSPEDIPESDRFIVIGPSLAQLALALALTDSGLDGREPAHAALAAFRELEEDGTIGEGDHVAFACYVAAYSMRPHGDDFHALAQEAVDRYTALSESVPSLFEKRLADARALAAAGSVS